MKVLLSEKHSLLSLWLAVHGGIVTFSLCQVFKHGSLSTWVEGGGLGVG